MSDVPITFVDYLPSGRESRRSSSSSAEGQPAGAARWRAIDEVADRRLGFLCPCGCGCYHSIPVARPGEPARQNAWQWNGSADKPTLMPSILCKCCSCQWHGYLTDGVFRSV